MVSFGRFKRISLNKSLLITMYQNEINTKSSRVGNLNILLLKSTTRNPYVLKSEWIQGEVIQLVELG